MKTYFNRILLCVLIVAITSSTYAVPPEGQTVTFTDFSLIRDIATSISRVFFATTNGITVYNKFDEKWEDPLTGRYGIDDWDIYRVWTDHFGGEVYAQTSNDLYEFDSLADRWYGIDKLPQLESDDEEVSIPKVMFPPTGFNYLNDGRLVDPVGRYFVFKEMIKDGSGQLWAGTWGYGAATASSLGGSIKLLPFGLIQPRVNTIYRDSDGYLWVSGAILNANRTGITIFDPYSNDVEYVESGIYRNFPAFDVNFIVGDDKTVYVGTEIGLIAIDAETHEVLDRLDRTDGLTDENILSIAVNGDSVFVGTERGVNLIVPEGDSIGIFGPTQLLGDIIYDLEIVDSALWIASSSGAYRWTWGNDKLQQYQDPHLVVFSQCFAIEHWKNFLWLASRDGLVRINLKTGDTEPFKNQFGGVDYRALSVNDSIAVMSSNRGMTILYYTQEKAIEREFSTDDGLPSHNVFDLKLDGDYIWVGTDKGLTRFWWNNPSRVD